MSSTTRPDTGKFDVIIVGAGPAGSAAAVELTRLGLAVALVDGRGRETFQVGEHLAPRAHTLLARVGLDPEALGKHQTSPGILSCWGGEEIIYKDYMFGMKGNGINLDRALFDRQLVDVAAADCRYFKESRCRNFRFQQNQWTITVESPKQETELTARFVIDASGAGRTVARKMGDEVHEADTLLSITFWHRLSDSAPNNLPWLLIESVPYGWWYSLRLTNNVLAVVMLCRPDWYREHRESLASVMKQTAPQTQSRLDHTTEELARQVVPVPLSRLRNIHGDGWLAVGDSAAILEPVLGDGISHALESGMSGAKAASEYLNGLQCALSEYAVTQRDYFSHQMQKRQEAYLIEQRWPDEPFWDAAHKAPNVG